MAGLHLLTTIMVFKPNTSLEGLSGIPAGIPPPGISPNFVNPQTLAPAILAVSIVMMLWTIVFVIIRLYTNFHAPRGLGIDDYFSIIAIALATASTGLIFSINRMARHIFDIPIDWVDGDYLKRSYALNVIVGPTIFFAKSTIFLLYLRVFAIKKQMKYGVWLGLFWSFLLYWIGVPLETYFCAPRIGKGWNIEALNKTCSDYEIFSVVQGVLAVVLDLYIFVLPIPTILRLQMALKRKLSILAIFGTAILGITAAVVAMVYRINLSKSNDPFWANAAVYICLTCESYVAIVIGSMPAFASFFKGEMPGASWLTGMNSLVRSNTVTPSSGGSMIPGGHTREKGYHELGSVRTDIRGEGAAPRTLEEGVVYKTVAVHQSMRQGRPAA